MSNDQLPEHESFEADPSERHILEYVEAVQRSAPQAELDAISRQFCVDIMEGNSEGGETLFKALKEVEKKIKKKRSLDDSKQSEQ